MANIKSANKRIKINKRNRLKNRKYKGNIKNTIKIYLQTVKQYQNSNNPEDFKKVKELLNLAYSQIDKAAKNNIFHKNKAARKKSQLTNYLKTN